MGGAFTGMFECAVPVGPRGSSRVLAVPDCCLGIPKLDAVGRYPVIASGTRTMLSTVLIPSESMVGQGASGAGVSTPVDATDARRGESIPSVGGAIPRDPWVSIMIKSV